MNAALEDKLDKALHWDRACGGPTPNSTSESWAIVGERDSGTNHMTRTVQANFDAKQTQPFFKHMYDDDEDWISRYRNSSMVYLFMVRDPAQWLMAMYDNRHECGEMAKGRSFSQFLRASPWSSIAHNNGKASVLAGDSYENVLHLRRTKLRYMKLALEYAAEHPETHRAVHIRHEDAADDPEAVLCKIRDHLRLTPLKPAVSAVDSSCSA